MTRRLRGTIPTSRRRSTPPPASACNVVRDPLGTSAPHAVPQEMPAGELTIVPLPVTLTASGFCVGWTPPIAAVTERARVDRHDARAAARAGSAPAHGARRRQRHGDTSTEGGDASPAADDPGHVAGHRPAGRGHGHGIGRVGRREGRGDSARITHVHGHEPAPEHAPDQPENFQPGVGIAMSVTVLSVANCAVHVAPQSIPPGWLVTLPLPLTVTASGNCAGRTRTNVALTWYVFPDRGGRSCSSCPGTCRNRRRRSPGQPSQ